VGEGEIDFGPIFAARRRSGVKNYFVERDDAASDPEGSLGSAEDSYDNLVARYRP
jgi:sugar phosphate isomerase/epimerase